MQTDNVRFKFLPTTRPNCSVALGFQQRVETYLPISLYYFSVDIKIVRSISRFQVLTVRAKRWHVSIEIAKDDGEPKLIIILVGRTYL